MLPISKYASADCAIYCKEEHEIRRVDTTSHVAILDEWRLLCHTNVHTSDLLKLYEIKNACETITAALASEMKGSKRNFLVFSFFHNTNKLQMYNITVSHSMLSVATIITVWCSKL